jgi:hypothetical protein
MWNLLLFSFHIKTYAFRNRRHKIILWHAKMFPSILSRLGFETHANFLLFVNGIVIENWQIPKKHFAVFGLKSLMASLSLNQFKGKSNLIWFCRNVFEPMFEIALLMRAVCHEFVLPQSIIINSALYRSRFICSHNSVSRV